MKKNPASNREVQGVLTESQAVEESSRCYNCGICVTCDNCLIFCPDLAIYCANDSYIVRTEYCKGCGICAQECPRGVITMERKS